MVSFDKTISWDVWELQGGQRRAAQPDGAQPGDRSP
jgi:hypothetical protein